MKEKEKNCSTCKHAERAYALNTETRKENIETEYMYCLVGTSLYAPENKFLVSVNDCCPDYE